METEGPAMKDRRKSRDVPEETLKAFRQFEAESMKAYQRFKLECQACQSEAEPHWQFCAHCGARLATRCPTCGTPLPPSGAKTCPHCGIDIPEVTPPGPGGGER